MKTARFLFAVAGLMALTIGPGFADAPPSQSSKPKVQEKHKTSGSSDASTHANLVHQKKVPPDGKNPKPKVNDLHSESKINGRHSKPANHGPVSKGTGQTAPINRNSKPTPANGRPQSEPNKTAASPRTIMTKTGSQMPEAAKLPVGSGATTPAARITRDHGTTTAAVGGLAASNVKKSAAAINGASIHRKF
jgi:hypothetical protein